MSSKAPPKSKSPVKKQTTTKARKGSTAAAGAGTRSQASARARATAKKTAAGTARRSEARRATKQPEAPEDDAVKPEAGAGRAKGAAASKASRSSGTAKATRTSRTTKTGKAAKSGTKAGRGGRAGSGSRSGTGGETRRRKKAPTKVNGFAVGDHVVYPAHGVGRITGIDERAVGDQTLQMFVVAFEKDKMTLLVPTGKVDSAGMRRLSSRETMDAAISALRGRARTRRVMWSRRAQEYEAKLNSGDPVSIAEVVRDLHRNVGQPDQSYSERQMYEAALDRLAREFAAVENTDTEQAANKLEDVLRAA